MSTPITGGNATIFVSDHDRAVEFYTKTLGLTLAYHAPGQWASLKAGDLTVGLHPSGEKAAQPGTAGAIEVGFQVSGPIQAAVDALTAKGVKFRGPVIDDGGGIKLAFFGDLDDNRLYLFSFGT